MEYKEAEMRAGIWIGLSFEGITVQNLSARLELLLGVGGWLVGWPWPFLDSYMGY